MANSLKSIFPLYTLKDLMEMLPAELKINQTAIAKEVKKAGCYRDVLGNMAFTEKDIEQFLEYLRAVPSEEEASARLGAGRFISGGAPAPNATGYLVIIGEQMTHHGHVFVGWAPTDDRGVSELKMAVQFGYPAELVVLGFRAGTPKQVADLKEELKDYRTRSDSDAWYPYDSEAGEILRDYMSSPVPDEDDEDNGARPTNGAKKD